MKFRYVFEFTNGMKSKGCWIDADKFTLEDAEKSIALYNDNKYVVGWHIEFN